MKNDCIFMFLSIKVPIHLSDWRCVAANATFIINIVPDNIIMHYRLEHLPRQLSAPGLAAPAICCPVRVTFCEEFARFPAAVTCRGALPRTYATSGTRLLPAITVSSAFPAPGKLTRPAVLWLMSDPSRFAGRIKINFEDAISEKWRHPSHTVILARSFNIRRW